MKCDECKYADWKRTSSGRMHPDKSGRCLIKKVVKLPECLVATSSYRTYGDEVVVKGGYIRRGRTFDRCAYYGPNKG